MGGAHEEMLLCAGCERESALEVERDRLAAENARLKADLDAAQALSAQGATMVAALSDQHQALRAAIVAHLDAEHRVDPSATAAARQQLRALVGWTPPREVLRPRGIATLHPSAARRMGVGGGSGTRSGEG